MKKKVVVSKKKQARAKRPAPKPVVVRQVVTVPEPVAPPPPPPPPVAAIIQHGTSGRAAVDWAAAGRKAWETRQRNLAAKAAANGGVPPAIAPSAGKVPASSSVEKWVARVLAAITRTDKEPARTSPYIGADCGGGYVVRATDGHRALAQLGTAAADAKKVRLVEETLPHGFDLTPALEVGVRQLRDTNKAHIVTLTIAAANKQRTVTLSAKPDKGSANPPPPPIAVPVDGAVKGKVKPLAISLNAKYLLDACGRGGRFTYANGEKAIALDVPDGWRYILMPVRP